MLVVALAVGKVWDPGHDDCIHLLRLPERRVINVLIKSSSANVDSLGRRGHVDVE